MSGAAPWSEVRQALDGPRVAAELGLKAARERHKFACVRCDSSDAMHVYGDGAKCFACGWSGSVIDLAAVRWGLEPDEACRRLAERFGIRPDPIYRATRSERNPAEPKPCDELVQRRRVEVLGDLVARTTLEAIGRDYLDGRGLSADLAAVHGFRSTESFDAWRTTWLDLERTHGDEAMAAAGLHRDAKPWLPWGGRVPALLMPYLDRDAQVVAVRWRRADDARERRYMTPLGGATPIPWGAEVVDGPEPLEVVIAEGEIDALALRQDGYDSLGLGGASPSRAVLDWLAEHLEDANKIALWLDNDPAGEGAARRVAQALARRHGVPWTRAHVVLWRSKLDPADAIGGAA